MECSGVWFPDLSITRHGNLIAWLQTPRPHRIRDLHHERPLFPMRKQSVDFPLSGTRPSVLAVPLLSGDTLEIRLFERDHSSPRRDRSNRGRKVREWYPDEQ